MPGKGHNRIFNTTPIAAALTLGSQFSSSSTCFFNCISLLIEFTSFVLRRNPSFSMVKLIGNDGVGSDAAHICE
jgi:hypothetical protein